MLTDPEKTSNDLSLRDGLFENHSALHPSKFWDEFNRKNSRQLERFGVAF